MTTANPMKRISVPEIRARKGGERIVCLTAYTAATAKLIDPYVDMLIVGDSLGMVLYGLETTLGVTLRMMIDHGAAVVRGSERACVIIDLPFGSYQESPAQALRTSVQVMAETGCAGVKFEGGVEMAETISFLVGRGIPVLGHVGLMPQSVMSAGGYRAQGKSEDQAARILADAEAVADAGAFAVVVEGTMEPVAREITERIAVPTIGIGASPACDGQVLVTEDLVGLTAGFTPKFVKRYADLGHDLAAAASAFARDVRSGRFPGPEHCYGMKQEGPRSEPSASQRAARDAG